MALLGDYGGMGFGAGARSFMDAYNQAAGRRELSRSTGLLEERQKVLDAMQKQQHDWQMGAPEREAAKELKQTKGYLSTVPWYAEGTPEQQEKFAQRFTPGSAKMFAEKVTATPKAPAGLTEFKSLYGRDPESPAEYVGFLQSKQRPSNQYQISIPSGFQPTFDQQGRPTGIEPIPGGPEAAKVTAAEEAEETGKKVKGVYADVVSSSIDRAMDLVKKSEMPTTGFWGAASANIPGTPAHDLQQTITSIEANIGFDRLQQMRDASKTGGALGQVSERELALLTGSMRSLKQSQSEEQFVSNLEYVNEVYNQIVHGKPASVRPSIGEEGQTKRKVYNPETGMVE